MNKTATQTHHAFARPCFAPAGVAGLSAAGRRSRIATRLALRDLARYQARSGAALAAISLAVGVSVAVVVGAASAQAASVEQATGGNLPTNELIVWIPPKGLAPGVVPVSTASVIKVPILVESMYQVKAGKVSLDDMLSLTKEDQVSGSGVLWLFRAPAQINFETALTLMITQSDNTATNMSIDAVGLKPTNQMLADMGLKNTYFYKKVYVKATEPLPADFKQFGLGKTTPREMAAVMT